MHTGQNWDYTLNDIFFNELGIRKPDYFLNSAGNNLGTTLGQIIQYSYDLLVKEKPDALLVLGDTNSALSTISAKRLKIPIFHMEAGNRCFDWNVPEETNRCLVDHISHVNLPYTEHARRNLIAEGLDPRYIFVTGSPLTEVLHAHFAAIDHCPVLTSLGLESKKYFLVSAHREENVDDESHFMSLMHALDQVAQTYKLPIIFSTHPRTQNIITKHAYQFNPLIQSVKPFGFIEYNKLQKEALCVLSDSGTIYEEASLLHFAAVSIRTATERPESIDKGSVVLGGITAESILQSIQLVLKQFLLNASNPPHDYQDLNVSSKIAYIIQSYTPIINEYVYRKK